jgi:hypothetical protein
MYWTGLKGKLLLWLDEFSVSVILLYFIVILDLLRNQGVSVSLSISQSGFPDSFHLHKYDVEMWGLLISGRQLLRLSCNAGSLTITMQAVVVIYVCSS